MDLDPAGDKVDHTLAISAATTDPIYQSSLGYDSEGGRKVYMVGNGEELPDKTVEEIQREAEEEIACAAHLAREAERERGTMACRMTQVHRKMSLGMALP
jgi:hypothetical protein